MGESSGSNDPMVLATAKAEIKDEDSSIPPPAVVACVARSGEGMAGGGCDPRSIEERIQTSKSHWSQVAEFASADEVAEESNVELFRTLKKHPKWGGFFATFGAGEGSAGELVVGQKIAEGGQAEIYEAQVVWKHPSLREHAELYSVEWVLKVFKKGTFLSHLQAKWPQGLLEKHVQRVRRAQLGLSPFVRTISDVYRATLLNDGRFAFLMVKESEDLRNILDRAMFTTSEGMGPLSRRQTELIMYSIALGMDELHRRGIVHRDIKASNVLCTIGGRFVLADYECSVGVVGTGFFRAPEILKACKERNVNTNTKLFTKAVDVYSYGMTCYEILTGKLPFEGHPLYDYDLVLEGERPEVPEYVDDWVRDLLKKCWRSNPAARPTSRQVLKILLKNSVACREQQQHFQKQERQLGLKSDLARLLWMVELQQSWKVSVDKLKKFWSCSK